jgi:spore coat polysaccharide biosynthesis protein SpsF
MNIGLVIQTRMGNTRFRGKTLQTVLDKTLHEYQVERLKQCKIPNKLIYIFPKDKDDDTYEEICKKQNLLYFRGSTNDVLDRYYQTAIHYKLDIIIRLTGDCPLVDPDEIDKIIQYLIDSKLDYVSNVFKRIDSRGRGMDTEAFWFNTLEKTFYLAKEQKERENVTYYIYTHSEEFNIHYIDYPNDVCHYRLTVDTPDDFQLIKKIIEELYPNNPNFRYRDIACLLINNPDWLKLNEYVEQKKQGDNI